MTQPPKPNGNGRSMKIILGVGGTVILLQCGVIGRLLLEDRASALSRIANIELKLEKMNVILGSVKTNQDNILKQLGAYRHERTADLKE